MASRIRYNRISDRGILSSRRAFHTPDGREYTVELDTTTFTFKIYDNRTRAVITTGGHTRNLNVLKVQAKDALTNLGVTFESEDRAPKRKFPSVRNKDYEVSR